MASRVAMLAAGFTAAGALLWWLASSGQTARVRATASGDPMLVPVNAGGSPVRYFTAAEFGVWWPFMNPLFVARLDAFRHQLGTPVMISPAAGSLGRVTGPTSSQHHVSNTPLAVADVMLYKIVGGRRVGLTPQELQRAFNIAKGLGFTGIGVYPDWTPYPGMHLDMRTERDPGDPATWSRVDLADGSQSDDMPVTAVWV